jgi:hypothetical protein
MISAQTLSRIRDLWQQGQTQTAIARQVQVSRGTVRRAVRGTWGPRPMQPRQVRRLLELWEIVAAAVPATPLGWCDGCPEPVYLPCVSCLAALLVEFGCDPPGELLHQECQCAGTFARCRPE